ncbi:MAG: DNA primase [Candidatus Saccharibacteria bacterium]
MDEVKSRLNIEDVIGEYVQLKRAGRNWKGLSPFSEERSPSFMVSPEKQIWHDFSSGKGGNVFSFIMEVEGLDFKSALELLARKAGVDLDQYRTNQSGSRGQEKERLYELLDLAAKFYQVQLRNNRPALEYVLGKRQFSKETAVEWRIGYSPTNGSALIDFLKSKKFTEVEMKSAGVSTQRYRGVGDMFRGRIMIPLCDAQGRVIGFTARLLRDDPNAPKYINTPQTVLYDKSRHVYGLHLAKESIRKSKFVVVAEGNLDVIASHQVGVRQVVATAGTALTEQHLQALGRFTGDIRLSFDADKAGLNATERAIPIASKVKISLSIISIPSGKDPDELIKQDPEIWKKVIQTPQYALDWLIDRYQKLLDIHSGSGKREFTDIILHVVRELNDPVEQDHYIGEVAKLIGVSQDALRTKLSGQQEVEEARPKKRVKVTPQLQSRELINIKRSQDLVLAIALMRPKLRQIALEPLDLDMLVDDDGRTMLTFLREHPDFVGGATAGEELRPIADYGKILSLQFEQWDQNFESIDLQNSIVNLHKNLIAPYVKIKQQEILDAQADAGDDQKKLLSQEYNRLTQLLKLYKGGA